MYLDADTSVHLVSTMLAHARVMVAITGVADPMTDNATLPGSRVRANDHAFIHNIDRMVVSAGGHVAWRRWDGGRQVDGISLYTVLATRR